MKTKGPSEKDVVAELGKARDVWDAITREIGAKYAPIEREWKTSKSSFGWMCVLKHKNRTLLYLTPDAGAVRVAVVLGERAVELALASGIPEPIKALIREARPYAEGRGIRFTVCTRAEIPVITELVVIKTTPK
jgi:hypothetical protein